VSHNTLKNFYETNFALMQHHKWSLKEIEDMIPWERDVYVGQLSKWLKEEKERFDQKQAEQRARAKRH
jgi:hypothetical protein